MNKNKIQKLKFENGFTLVELVVVIAIVSVLSMVVMFSISQYVGIGKDTSISGNLAVLIPAGEAYYNIENTANNDGYTGFCSATVVVNAFAQMPVLGSNADCKNSSNLGVPCCNVAGGGASWAACAEKFVDTTKAFCVDSRGVKREICNSQCISSISICPEILSSCPL